VFNKYNYNLVLLKIKPCDHVIYILFQAFGRTPLTNISPKKTLEGALAGLGGCVLTTVILSTILQWPRSLLRCDFWVSTIIMLKRKYFSSSELPCTTS
jgi:CDP-diglyceride synthetase